MKKLAIIAVVMLASTVAFARPASPNPVEVEQPDGSKITIILKGDERIKWAETEDGYSLLRDESGYWEYATKAENGDMVASGVIASDVKKNAMSVKSALIANTPKHLMFSTVQKQAIFADENTPNPSRAGINLAARYKAGEEIVKHKIPVIIVSFADKSCKYGKKDFDSIFNIRNLVKTNYTGSVADYFYDNSRGKFLFEVDIFGPYVLSQNMSYYGGNTSSNNTSDKNTRAMVREAIIAANGDGCDFSNYDGDNDGYVDGVHIIFAGLGEEEGGGSDAIWSHKWTLYPAASLNGKKVEVYSCSPELRGSRAKVLAGIGAATHELGHAIGLPDFYDTDYEESGGESVTPGTYEIMDVGSYNDNGYTPPQYNAWSKMFLGWNEKYVLDSASTVEIFPATEEYRTYVIETKRANEYFILDNRPISKWDKWSRAYIGGGLLIFCVDSNYGNWGRNTVNNNPQRRSFYIKQANGGDNSTSGLGLGTPFPGTLQKRNFTDATTPSSRSKDGVATDKPITDITIDDNKHVLFNLLGGGDTVSSGGEATPPYVLSTEQTSEKIQNNISIFPNPASEKITVASSEKSSIKVKELSLYNMTGKRMAKSNKNEINVRTLPAGIYILEVKTDKTKTSHKVIITR